MWNNKTVAVIFPTYGEKRSIKNVLMEFDSTGYVDEIIVVNNNSRKGIVSMVKKTRARLITEPQQGYGTAIKTGIKSTSADLLVIAEPDGTFEGKDLVKFLSYSDDFDIVFGSRTHVPLIRNKAQMSFSKRITDVSLGKLISLLFLCPPLTDVSCNFRLTSRKAWQRIIKESKSESSLFGVEWLLIAAKNRIKFIQIPVNFRAKHLQSTPLSNQSKSELNVFLFILKIWFVSLIKKAPNILIPRYS